MKRTILTFLALSASLVTAGYLIGQTNKAASTPAAAAAAPAAKPQHLFKVVSLEDATAVREFQRNVQLVQSQRQAVIELLSAIEKEKDAKQKAEYEKKKDEVLARLQQNNDAMVKNYGFSLERNYTMEIERASIYMLVTPEEAAKLEAEQKAKETKDGKKK